MADLTATKGELTALGRYLTEASESQRIYNLRVWLARIAETSLPRHKAGEEAFAKALAETPCDSTAWGVYGDWLEERGDQKAAAVAHGIARHITRGYPDDNLGIGW